MITELVTNYLRLLVAPNPGSDAGRHQHLDPGRPEPGSCRPSSIRVRSTKITFGASERLPWPAGDDHSHPRPR